MRVIFSLMNMSTSEKKKKKEYISICIHIDKYKKYVI